MPGLNGVQNAIYLSDFSFVNENVGWANPGGSVIMTSDGGENWTEVNSMPFLNLKFIPNSNTNSGYVGYARALVGSAFTGAGEHIKLPIAELHGLK